MLPDTGCLSEQLRVCLQEGDENPRDFTSLFDMSLSNLSTDTLPKAIRWEFEIRQLIYSKPPTLLIIPQTLKLNVFCSAYKQLDVKDEPLQLITPQFETPLPQLQPAVSFKPEFLYQLRLFHTNVEFLLSFETERVRENTFWFEHYKFKPKSICELVWGLGDMTVYNGMYPVCQKSCVTFLHGTHQRMDSSSFDSDQLRKGTV